MASRPPSADHAPLHTLLPHSGFKFIDKKKIFSHIQQEGHLITAAVCYTRAKVRKIAPSAITFAPEGTTKDLDVFTEDFVDKLLEWYHDKAKKPVIGNHTLAQVIESAGMEGILSHKILAMYLVEVVLGRIAYRLRRFNEARTAAIIARNGAAVSDIVRAANKKVGDLPIHLAMDKLAVLAMETQFLRKFRLLITDEDFADLRLLGTGSSDVNRNAPDAAPFKKTRTAPRTSKIEVLKP